jgi:alpha-D-xyloside xylohydrolase
MKKYTALALFFVVLSCNIWASGIQKEEIVPGVYKLTAGSTDKHTPYNLLAKPANKESFSKIERKQLPFNINDIKININKRGCQVAIPLVREEQLYGFGMQIGSYQQRGLKKKPIVNDHPLNNLGYTHAPQTFYVSTEGYGIIINTARYTTFMCGSNKLKEGSSISANKQSSEVRTNTEDLYKANNDGDYVFVDIPNAEGIEVFVIEGVDIKSVVERYNLLSGGGCIPPMWGLGLKYRVKGDYNEQQVLDMADYFRNSKIPCDVLGLEPGWQTAAYSCSYVWNKDRFPDPKRMTTTLDNKGFKTNLWEHAYVHPSSPIHKELSKYSGDFLVWNGLVPDFTLPEAREIFSKYHETLIADGIMSFKLDECDNSNIGEGSATWGFPDMTNFPSGLDGEQMHQLFGSLYLKTMDEMYRKQNIRTYQDYRASGMFMSSYPATLYSDIYGHEDYIQMVCNSAFGGLLWSPELRESTTEEELFHRLHTVLLSPQALVNSWYLYYPPWLQYNKDKNNKGELLPNKDKMEADVRELINMRMSLIPYIYSAFHQYNVQGTPPFRPLLMDFQDDKKTLAIYDQYMIGDNIMVAPLYKAGNKRKVYFPSGTWYNFYTHEVYEGNKEYEIETKFSEMPIYIKSGSIIPLAEPVLNVAKDTVFKINCLVFGEKPSDFTLFEDDGISYDFEKGQFNQITLSSDGKKGKVDRKGSYKQKRYIIDSWKFIK